MANKKAIIFDFFDVVYQDPLKRWSKTHSIVYEPDISEIAFRLDTGASTYRQYLTDLAKLGGQTVEELESEFATAQLNQEMVDLIKKLKDNFQTALLSNTNHEEINPIFELYNLPPIFDEIIISSDTGLAKPDLKIYQIALKRLGVQSKEAIFIDDNAKNVAAAKKMGMSGIVYQDMPELRNKLKQLGLSAS